MTSSLPAAFLIAVLTLSVGAIATATGFELPTTVGKGRIGAHRWYVEAKEEGSGICFEVSVYGRGSREAESGLGQCSYPAKRRGILLVVANRQTGDKPPVLMAVGGAFNRAVRRVVVKKFNGHVQQLTLRSPPSGASTAVSSFRYLAFAVHGPWCAARVTTFDRHRHVLWQIGWRELDSQWRHNLSFNPAALCPR